jgi:S-DNA-T family DNA segregation ATPase FtsK/SpoIIIE
MPEEVKPKPKATKKLPEDPEPVMTEPFLTQERLLNIFGLFCLFFSIFLFVAFFSYLFTWKADQDQVFNFSWRLIYSQEALVENSMGRLGALLSHFFFYDLCGLGTFFSPSVSSST